MEEHQKNLHFFAVISQHAYRSNNWQFKFQGDMDIVYYHIKATLLSQQMDLWSEIVSTWPLLNLRKGQEVFSNNCSFHNFIF